MKRRQYRIVDVGKGVLNINTSNLHQVLGITDGSTSGTCLDDFYVSNIHACSPLTIHGEMQSNGSIASGTTAFAFGNNNVASGDYSHAEGDNTTASGNASHAEGFSTNAIGLYSHVEGWGSISSSLATHAEGHTTTASGSYGSHAEGWLTTASGDYASHAEGTQTTASGIYGAHAEGQLTLASGTASHAEGDSTTASGTASHAEGDSTTASGTTSHAEGLNTVAGGTASHAEGNLSTASGSYSHAEGLNTLASGTASHSEGALSTASGMYSHAEGAFTTASGGASHSEGGGTTASGYQSHAQGRDTTASGIYSHSEGHNTTASGEASHAGGVDNEAFSYAETVIGLYSTTYSPNDTDNFNASDRVFNVGVGDSIFQRRDGLTIYKGGQIVAPELTIAKIDGGDDKGLVTKEWVTANAGSNETISVSGTSVSPSSSNANKVLLLGDASPVTFTIPNNSTDPIPVDSTYRLINTDTGLITIGGEGSVTLLEDLPSLTMLEGAVRHIQKIGTDLWVLW